MIQQPDMDHLQALGRRWARLTALVAALAIAGEAAAQFTPGQRGGPVTADQLVDVRVIADRTEVGPGETFYVLTIFDIRKPWHLYWKNPGEAGALAPSVALTVPDGFSVGELRWPRPKLINSPAGELFCYEDQLALFVPVTAPAELNEGPVTIQAAIRYAVCEADRCLIGTATGRPRLLATNSATNDGSASDALPERDMRLIERHRSRLPHDIAETDEASITLRDETLTISVPAHGFQRMTFFPLDSPGVAYGKPEVGIEDDMVTISVSLKINPNNFRGGPPKVGGLVALGRQPDGPSYEGAIALTQ